MTQSGDDPVKAISQQVFLMSPAVQDHIIRRALLAEAVWAPRGFVMTDQSAGEGSEMGPQKHLAQPQSRPWRSVEFAAEIKGNRI